MTVITFIIVLAVLILVHEFGHFIVAKKSGIRVDEFGLGFPPKVYGYKPKGSETEYSLNWIPFGGFVRIFGEDPRDEEAVNGPDAHRSFLNKPKSTQAAVLVAGVLFNFIFAWLIFSLGFIVGTPQDSDGRYADRVEGSAIIVTSVLPDSPAKSSELMPGDNIIAINGEENLSVLSIQKSISTSGGENQLMLIEREGERQIINVTPQKGVVGERYAVGITMANIGTLKLPVHLAIWEGLRVSGQMAIDITVGFSVFIYQAFTGQADLGAISGPVGIAGMVGDASTLGILHLLFFTAFISINLAVLNLIPFPALDGGRLLFVLIEKIKGSPINPKIAGTLNFIGFALLILLLVVVTYNDIVRLF